MTKPKDPRNPSWTKLGNPQTPCAEQHPAQNKSKGATTPQKGHSAPKGKVSGTVNHKAPHGNPKK